MRGLQDGLRSGPRAGRQHQHRGAPRPRHRRYDPRSRPPLVPSRTVPAVALVCAGRCLSRMREIRMPGSELGRPQGVPSYLTPGVASLKSAEPPYQVGRKVRQRPANRSFASGVEMACIAEGRSAVSPALAVGAILDGFGGTSSNTLAEGVGLKSHPPRHQSPSGALNRGDQPGYGPFQKMPYAQTVCIH